MKDYYQILQVSKLANEIEIKRAYRRLAIQFHPDKNPSKGAEQLFKEINEAYEVLGDSSARASYDRRVANPYTETLTPPGRPSHRDPAYRRKRPGTRVKSERERLVEMMVSLRPITSRILLVSFGVSIFLALDFLIPLRESTERIVSTYKTYTYARKGSTTWWVVNTDHGSIIDIPYSRSDDFVEGNTIRIESTRILDIPINVEGTRGALRLQKSIYGSFAFAPIVLFLTSGIGLYFRKRTEIEFNTGVISSLILLLTFVIYLMVH